MKTDFLSPFQKHEIDLRMLETIRKSEPADTPSNNYNSEVGHLTK
jgi:hypothetical protein